MPVSYKAIETSSYQSFLAENPLYQVALESLLESNPGLANVWVPSAYSIYYAFQANIMDVLNGKDIDLAVKEMAATVNDAIAAYNSQN